MFVFRPSFEFNGEVKVIDPTGVESVFTARFLYVDDKRWDELAADSDTDRRILSEVWLGWSGIVDEQQQPIAFSADAREMFILTPYVRGAVMRAYVSERHGLRAKN